MTWFKVDDKLHAHKKAARAGEAMALWVIAGSWAADQLTDGFVPDYIVARLIPDGLAMADKLVVAGLWTADTFDGDDGFRFRDWCDYQPTKDEVEAKRERERDKKRNQRRNEGGQFTASPDESPSESPEVSLGDNLRESQRESDRPVPSRPETKKVQDDAVAPAPVFPRIVNDGTFTEQVIAWGRADGHTRQINTKAERTRWALDLASHHLGDTPRGVGAATELVVEWVEHACGEPLATPARKHLVRLINTETPGIVFAAMEAAVTGGAGLSQEYAEDPQALVRYAKSCISRWRVEGSGRAS